MEKSLLVLLLVVVIGAMSQGFGQNSAFPSNNNLIKSSNNGFQSNQNNVGFDDEFFGGEFGKFNNKPMQLTPISQPKRKKQGNKQQNRLRNQNKGQNGKLGRKAGKRAGKNGGKKVTRVTTNNGQLQPFNNPLLGGSQFNNLRNIPGAKRSGINRQANTETRCDNNNVCRTVTITQGM